MDKNTEESDLIVAYEGEALDSNTMDVKELAPALLAIGELFERANRLVNDDQSSIKVHIKSTSPGSFIIDLHIFQSILSRVLDIFSGSTITGLLNLKEVIFGDCGVLAIIKFLRNKKPTSITQTADDSVTLELDGMKLTTKLSALKLYQDISFRKILENVSEPLYRQGFDKISFSSRAHQYQEIVKQEADLFKAPELADEQITESILEKAFTIVSLAFREDNKWRLYDGNTTIYATIKDQEFLSKIEKSEISFTKGDILICSVKMKQFQTGVDLVTEYEVEAVKEHRAGTRQLALL